MSHYMDHVMVMMSFIYGSCDPGDIIVLWVFQCIDGACKRRKM